MFSYLIERGLIARIDRPRLRLGQSRRPGGAKITHSSQRTSTKVKQRTQSSSRAEQLFQTRLASQSSASELRRRRRRLLPLMMPFLGGGGQISVA